MTVARSSVAAAAFLAFFGASQARGFSFYGPTEELATAARFDARALADGVQVGVDPGFAATFGASTPAEVAFYEQVVRDAFAAWESPALHFDITFGSTAGAEISLVGLTGSDPLGGFYGYAYPNWSFDATRVLTNGAAAAGYVITDALVEIASEKMITALVLFDQTFQGYAIQRLIMHEVGHTLGLGHTNDTSLLYYDTDLDPTNEIVIDPSNPSSGLIVSPNRLSGTIMASRPCGASVVCNATFATSLTVDDRGGRDFLYPSLVPEPAAGALLVTALAALARRRRIC